MTKATGQMFTLGMITAFCIQGALDAVGYEPLIKIEWPWWFYVIAAIGAVALATIRILTLERF